VCADGPNEKPTRNVLSGNCGIGISLGFLFLEA
jgi:hypothetical protein